MMYHSITHDIAIPMLRERPGRELVKNICQVIKPWAEFEMGGRPDFVFYSSYAEFLFECFTRLYLPGRIDSVLAIGPEKYLRDRIPYCTIGIELKCTRKDLERDQKLDGKYLKASMCDYYFLVVCNEELVQQGLSKYANCPRVGVASLQSGRIYKAPTRSKVPDESRNLYSWQLEERKRSSENFLFANYYQQDRDLMMVDMNSDTQEIDILKFREDCKHDIMIRDYAEKFYDNNAKANGVTGMYPKGE